MSDGGEISKTLFWVFSPVSWVIWMFWFLDWKRSMKIELFEVVKPEIDLESLGIEFPKRSCMSVMWLQGFHKMLTEVNSNCH